MKQQKSKLLNSHWTQAVRRTSPTDWVVWWGSWLCETRGLLISTSQWRCFSLRRRNRRPRQSCYSRNWLRLRRTIRTTTAWIDNQSSWKLSGSTTRAGRIQTCMEHQIKKRTFSKTNSMAAWESSQGTKHRSKGKGQCKAPEIKMSETRGRASQRNCWL